MPGPRELQLRGRYRELCAELGDRRTTERLNLRRIAEIESEIDRLNASLPEAAAADAKAKADAAADTQEPPG